MSSTSNPPSNSETKAPRHTAHLSSQSRHSLIVRLTHWIATLSFVALLISGIAILVAHPRFYWGEAGNSQMPAWFVLPIQKHLGPSGWGRSLHFLAGWVMVGNGIIYVISGLLLHHFRRDLWPRRDEVRVRQVLDDVANHLKWKIREQSPGPRYGVLQKLSYFGVVFLVFPLIILTGLTMSPAVTAAYPELFSIFGGRQSARTIHFILALTLTLFVVIHFIMVIGSGFRKQMRGMTLGDRPS